MIINKIVALAIFILIYFLIRNVFRNKSKGRSDILVENIRTLGAAILLLIMAIGFFSTDKDFCELLPFFCKKHA